MSATPNTTPSGEVHATFEGEPIACAPGASVAAALIATGKNAWRETRTGASRGLFCGIGVCFDCLVDIDGESGQRACMIPLADGMDVRGATGPGATEHPSGTVGTDSREAGDAA
ncbi:(2Fe-2S)-binding protein [Leucobacter sp. G161]|uniref:(2Fe-2S)-binding protein n=1 Tax=Leucobacter sp. G161 TaxID=663704 RepID=UPI0009F8152F|nr:(2Fe-2S)-binding protein [Leucobacter sp. G161]